MQHVYKYSTQAKLQKDNAEWALLLLMAIVEMCIRITPIFSRDLANTSHPFFWLTKIMMGGSKPHERTSKSFFLFQEQSKNKKKNTSNKFLKFWKLLRVWILAGTHYWMFLPLLCFWHQNNLLFHSFMWFTCRTNIYHSRAPQVTPGQSLYSRRHSGCKHDCLKK